LKKGNRDQKRLKGVQTQNLYNVWLNLGKKIQEGEGTQEKDKKKKKQKITT